MRANMHENNETHALRMLNSICNENIKLYLQLQSKKYIYDTQTGEACLLCPIYTCTMGLHTQTHTNIVY